MTANIKKQRVLNRKAHKAFDAQKPSINVQVNISLS